MSQMSAGYELARFIIEFFSTVRQGDIEWQKQKLEEIAELKKKKRIHEVSLNHELEMLEVKFSEEIKRKQEEERRITNDYRDFLDSIEEMKQKMLETFSEMPKPMVHIIHHHAKHLIDEMWKANDEHSKALASTRFTNFLTSVYNDTTNTIADSTQKKLPTETLKLIQQQ